MADMHSVRKSRRLALGSLALTSLAALVLAGFPLAASAEPATGRIYEAAGSSFSSSFNGTRAGWKVVAGTWKLKASGKYEVQSASGNLGSIAHKDTYSNLVFSARMRRPSGSSGSFQGLVVRGVPAPLTGFGDWDSGYGFFYNDSGNVTVGRSQGGSFTLLLPATFSAAVVPNGWNILKVVVYGPALLFYVNGTLVYSAMDATPLPAGQVGIGAYGWPAEKAQVDWAKLSVIPY